MSSRQVSVLLVAVALFACDPLIAPPSTPSSSPPPQDTTPRLAESPANLPGLLGGGLNSGRQPSHMGLRVASQPCMVLDAAGNPWVAWAEDQEIYVARWDGSTWVQLGSPSAGHGFIGAWEPSLVLVAGKPVVAFRGLEEKDLFDPFLGKVVRVHVSNGFVADLDGAWRLREGVLSRAPGTAAWVHDVQLAAAADGTLFAAFVDNSNTRSGVDAYVARWHDSGWEFVGPPLSGEHSVQDVSLALNASGAPIIAWQDGYRTLRVSRWATGWVPVGEPVEHCPNTNDCDFVFDPVLRWGDAPLLASRTRRDSRVWRLEGSAWRELGPSLNGAAGVSHGSAAALTWLPNGEPLAAWTERDVAEPRLFLSWFSQGAWSSFTRPLPANGGAPSVQLDPSGHLVVAWSGFDGRGSSIFVMRL